MSELTLTPSPARRVAASLMIGGLGILLLWLGATVADLAFGWKVLLAVMGIAAFYMALQVWQATARHLVLEEEVLRDDAGRVICALSDIAAVDRGTFAFKPSNGFLIRLKTPGPRAWAPGLWWRFGRRIGVGGVTPAGQGKAMADVIAARVSGVGRID